MSASTVVRNGRTYTLTVLADARPTGQRGTLRDRSSDGTRQPRRPGKPARTLPGALPVGRTSTVRKSVRLP